MQKSRLVWGLATSITLAWGSLAALGACSSDNGTATTTPAPTTTVPAKDASPGDTYVPAVDGAAQDAGSECGTAAKLFPPKPDGGTFCPFSAAAGGKDIYCTNAQQCCENVKGAGVSTCETKGTACPIATATAWECEDPSNCAAGQKCCAHSGDAGVVTVSSDTCGPFLSKFSGTKCATTCAAGELVVCEQQSECTTGTCTAVKPKGNAIGVCK
jgi:hypothetical protein